MYFIGAHHYQASHFRLLLLKLVECAFGDCCLREVVFHGVPREDWKGCIPQLHVIGKIHIPYHISSSEILLFRLAIGKKLRMRWMKFVGL